MFDGKAFGQEVVAAVKAHVDKSLSPILARLAALEQRPVAAAEDIEGVKGDIKALREAVSGEMQTAHAKIDANLPNISALVAEAVAAIPAPAPGKDADPAMIKQMVEEAVAALPVPLPAKDVDMAEVAAKVTSEVERLLAGWDKPQDGKSVTVEELAPLVAESVERAVSAIPTPKDGVSVAGAIIDREGALHLTLSDGTTRDLGCVVGKDADIDALKAILAELVAAIPTPTDGKDGFGFDDLHVIHDGVRGFTFRFAKGERIKDFPFSLPVVLDCGVYKEGQAYQAGDGVTWAGSFWIAQEEAKDKPDSGKGWRLAVKRGRDGKDGVLKAEKAKEPLRVG